MPKPVVRLQVPGVFIVRVRATAHKGAVSTTKRECARAKSRLDNSEGLIIIIKKQQKGLRRERERERELELENFILQGL